MPRPFLLYYITDRTAFGSDEPTRRARLLEKIVEAARARVDYIQLREKDLPTLELESLAREVMEVLNQLRTANRELKTALLINSRTDIALAVGADGVHLRSDDVSPQDVRKIWNQRGAVTLAREPVIGVSCHSSEDVIRAERNGANFATLAPVFEKRDAPEKSPAGLILLGKACSAKIPVLALGGVSLENARSCLEAGAAGIAGIRLFQEDDVAETVRRLP